MSLSGRHDFLATGSTVQQATGQANIQGVIVSNEATSVIWMQIFDSTASDVDLGTTLADMAIATATGPGLGNSQSFDFYGAKFQTGFSYAITTTATGSTAIPQAWIAVVYV